MLFKRDENVQNVSSERKHDCHYNVYEISKTMKESSGKLTTES
jgi:hypothetical protein